MKSTKRSRISYIIRKHTYMRIFYRFVNAFNEEKLSVLGFEAIMLFLLLIGGSLIYLRRKQTASTAGLLNSEQLQVLSVPFRKLIRAASNRTVYCLQFHSG
ncbi:hypothetical protein ACFXTH_011474 [Malus domestica]